jgi:hypothetical protein
VAPAPWHLRGEGYLLAVWPPSRLEPTRGSRSSGAERRQGWPAWVIFADYREADCGPYRELLYLPGRRRFGKRRYWSIARIYVSSRASQFDGQRNWGIPKELCDFECERHPDGAHRVRALLAGEAFADLTLRPFGPRLPVTTVVVPASLRTFRQEAAGTAFTFAPSAHGWLRPARLVAARIDSRHFPGFTADRVLFGLRVSDVSLCFPPAMKSPRPGVPP